LMRVAVMRVAVMRVAVMRVAVMRVLALVRITSTLCASLDNQGCAGPPPIRLGGGGSSLAFGSVAAAALPRAGLGADGRSSRPTGEPRGAWCR
jgi:hypothetical protein